MTASSCAALMRRGSDSGSWAEPATTGSWTRPGPGGPVLRRSGPEHRRGAPGLDQHQTPRRVGRQRHQSLSTAGLGHLVAAAALGRGQQRCGPLHGRGFIRTSTGSAARRSPRRSGACGGYSTAHDGPGRGRRRGPSRERDAFLAGTPPGVGRSTSSDSMGWETTRHTGSSDFYRVNQQRYISGAGSRGTYRGRGPGERRPIRAVYPHYRITRAGSSPRSETPCSAGAISGRWAAAWPWTSRSRDRPADARRGIADGCRRGRARRMWDVASTYGAGRRREAERIRRHRCLPALPRSRSASAHGRKLWGAFPFFDVRVPGRVVYPARVPLATLRRRRRAWMPCAQLRVTLGRSFLALPARVGRLRQCRRRPRICGRRVEVGGWHGSGGGGPLARLPGSPEYDIGRHCLVQ